MELAEFKAFQRRLWGEGDYRPVGRLIEPAARTLVELAGVARGHRVLDVATGSGSVAVAAALAGADVVGVDITDAWFDEAYRRAHEAGVHIELILGDAEDLPIPDASFDVVLSSFGAIFAPRHEVVASELVRACRPGGTIGLTAWPPDGANAEVYGAVTSLLPAPPDFVSPSELWGDRAYVDGLFTSHGVALRFEQPSFAVSFESTDAFVEFALENSGGFRMAQEALLKQGAWDQAETALRRAMDNTNEAEDGRYDTTWDFLVVIGRTNAVERPE